MPTLYGLGDILDREKVVTSLQSIYRYNFKERLGDIYNPCRVFGMDDESGTVIATWPDERTQAGGAGALRAGDHARHGVRLRPDADGLWHARGGRRRSRPASATATTARRRNPWNEIECGSNYARSMASWGAMIVLSGFSFDATRGHIGFAPRLQDGGVFRSFWSGANAYGTVEFANGSVRVDVLGGDLDLEEPRPARRTAARPTARRLNGKPDRGRSAGPRRSGSPASGLAPGTAWTSACRASICWHYPNLLRSSVPRAGTKGLT